MNFSRWRNAMLLITLCAIVACAKAPENTAPQEAQRAPTTNHPLAPDRSPLNGQSLTAKTITPASTGATPVAVTKTVKVGLLLPLTGRNAELGKALQDAATVSLFDKYARLSANQQAVRVELLPKDTGDSPEFARKAMAEAIADGAEIIIGPIFSDATEVAAPLAAAKNINVLSFSNNRARGTAGVYLLGFSPQEQTTRVMNYALQHDKKRIAVLVPHSPLGDEVLSAARQAASGADLRLAAEAQYAPQAVGLEAALKKLLPADGSAPNFDALLLADGGGPLETILRTLSGKNITGANVQLLGTGIWDDPALLRRVNLEGAWFASSTPANTIQFENRFQTTYNYVPPRIASLAYDAVALVVALATSNRPFTTENLTNPGGFVGPANGIFRMKSGGVVERGLAVIQVEGSNLRVISPAPTGFTK